MHQCVQSLASVRHAVPPDTLAKLVAYCADNVSTDRSDEGDTERLPVLDQYVQWQLDLLRVRTATPTRDFVEENFLLERLVVERRVTLKAIQQINDHQDAWSLEDSVQTMRDQMSVLELDWNDNVRIEIGEPTMQGVDVTFTVNGVPMSLSSSV